MDERNLINGSLVSYLSWAAVLSHPYVGFILAAFALVCRLEIRDRSSTASGRNHTQKQGNTPKRKQNHRLSLLDTGRHEFWRSIRHTVRDSHITGTCAVSGVWLWNQFVFQQLLRSPGKQTANQHLQMVKKQVRYYGPLRRWKRYHENINFTSG